MLVKIRNQNKREIKFPKKKRLKTKLFFNFFYQYQKMKINPKEMFLK